MAVDYKPLNRNQEFSTPQKAALKKIFGFAEAAATGGDSTIVSRKKVHLALSGHFSANDRADIQALMKEIRDASDDADNARDLSSVFGAWRMEGAKRLVIKTMANAVVAQIV